MQYISAVSTESYSDARIQCLNKIFGIITGNPIQDHECIFGELTLSWRTEGSHTKIDAYKDSGVMFVFEVDSSFNYDMPSEGTYYAETYLFGDMTPGTKWFKFSPKQQTSGTSTPTLDPGFCGISIVGIGDVVFNAGSGSSAGYNFGYLNDGSGYAVHKGETYILPLTPLFSVNYGFTDNETSSGVVMIPYLPTGCLRSGSVIDTKLYLLQTNTMIATRSCGAMYLNGRPMVTINPLGIFGTAQGLGILAGEDKIGA